MVRTKQTCGPYRYPRHGVERKEDAGNDALGADSILETLCHYVLDAIPEREEKAAVLADLACIFSRGLSPSLQHEIEAKIHRNAYLRRVGVVFQAMLHDFAAAQASGALGCEFDFGDGDDSDSESDADSAASGAGRRGIPPGE